MELDELLRFKSPLLLPLFCVVFKEILAKKAGEWSNSPRIIAIVKSFWLLELMGMPFSLAKVH